MNKESNKSKHGYTGDERRDFLRLDYKTPLMFKICKKKTFSKLMQGYTCNISQAGLSCNLEKKVPVNAILWLQLDFGALSMCKEIEKNCAIIQHGILGKVVWTNHKEKKNYDVGVCFFTREEKTSNNWFTRQITQNENQG